MKYFKIILILIFAMIANSAIAKGNKHDCSVIESNMYTQKECTSEIVSENIITNIPIENFSTNIREKLTDKYLQQAIQQPGRRVLFYTYADDKQFLPPTVLWYVTYTDDTFVISHKDKGVTFGTILSTILVAISWLVVIWLGFAFASNLFQINLK